MHDLLVAGGGPAGLAVAIEAARRGLDVLVVERRRLPVDKACGEGLLPLGLRALDELGVLSRLDPSGCAPFRSIRWVSEDGTAAEAALPPPHGLGIRRLALSEALGARASELGAEVRQGCALEEHRVEREAVVARLGDGREERARLLVAADGSASPLRERAGLGVASGGVRRFGLRRHFAVAPWSDAVEVHFAEGAEAYLTPVGPRRVGLAILFEGGRSLSFDAWLLRFPRLVDRLASAPADSAVAGAGPLTRRASARTASRMVLAGDAGGSLDAITGEGLSLAFEGARLLGAALPEALARGGSREALLSWERAVEARYRRRALVVGLVLAMARRPAVRRRSIALLSRHPNLFSRLVGLSSDGGHPGRIAGADASRG